MVSMCTVSKTFDPPTTFGTAWCLVSTRSSPCRALSVLLGHTLFAFAAVSSWIFSVWFATIGEKLRFVRAIVPCVRKNTLC